MYKSKNKEKQTAKKYSFKRKREKKIGMMCVTRYLNNYLRALRIRIYENTL